MVSFIGIIAILRVIVTVLSLSHWGHSYEMNATAGSMHRNTHMHDPPAFLMKVLSLCSLAQV